VIGVGIASGASFFDDGVLAGTGFEIGDFDGMGAAWSSEFPAMTNEGITRVKGFMLRFWDRIKRQT